MADNDDFTPINDLAPFEHSDDSEVNKVLQSGNPFAEDLSDDIKDDSTKMELGPDDEFVSVAKDGPALGEELEDVSARHSLGAEEDLKFDTTLPNISADTDFTKESSFNMSVNKDVSEFLMKSQIKTSVHQDEIDHYETDPFPEGETPLLDGSEDEPSHTFPQAQDPSPESITEIPDTPVAENKKEQESNPPPSPEETEFVTEFVPAPTQLPTQEAVEEEVDDDDDDKKEEEEGIFDFAIENVEADEHQDESSAPFSFDENFQATEEEISFPQAPIDDSQDYEQTELKNDNENVQEDSVELPSQLPITTPNDFDSDLSEEQPPFQFAHEEIEAQDPTPALPNIEDGDSYQDGPPPEPIPENENDIPISPYEYESSKETFTDVKQFSEGVVYGEVSAAGNPPFSVLIKNVKYKEEAEDILRILKEFKLVDKSNEKVMRLGLENGSALISQLSEYTAIKLCHFFRRFDVDILMGLSDDIRPPKTKTGSARGLIGKEQIFRNKSEEYEFTENSRPENIILSTTSILSGHEINKYMGVVSEHTVINQEDLENPQGLQNKLENESYEKNTSFDTRLEHNLDSPEIQKEKIDLQKYNASLTDIYNSLADKLRYHAIKLKGNAVVGINYQITPVLIDDQNNLKSLYKITCTGSVVQVR